MAFAKVAAVSPAIAICDFYWSEVCLVDTVKNITVIVPTVGRSERLDRLLGLLQRFGLPWVVVQAGTDDAAVMPSSNAVELGGDWLCAKASRGGQIAAGIAHSQTDWVWVVHDDSDFCESTCRRLQQLVATNRPVWGRFNVRFREQSWGLKLVARFMNVRSRLSKICTGDQAMFFHRTLLQDIGGFPQQPLMEDIEVSARLKRHASKRFVAAHEAVTTSGQRWLLHGLWATVVSMWKLRLRYYFGAQPDRLFDEYYRRRS
jgi:rSAM/selenodomain-associated transferase 2